MIQTTLLVGTNNFDVTILFIIKPFYNWVTTNL